MKYYLVNIEYHRGTADSKWYMKDDLFRLVHAKDKNEAADKSDAYMKNVYSTVEGSTWKIKVNETIL